MQLPFTVTWQHLKDEFSRVGPVARAEVVAHADGRSKGFGFITFVNPDDARKAICTPCFLFDCVLDRHLRAHLAVCVSFSAMYTGATMDGRRIDIHMDTK
jgi:hypothetical protein